MISYLLLSLLLFLGLFGYGQRRGARRLHDSSRRRRETLEACPRSLHPLEAHALGLSVGLALPAQSPLWRASGEIQVIGWRAPLFVLDGLLVALPEALLPCIAPYNRAQLVLNPHPGGPHAFVVALNGVSLVCECMARSAGFAPSAADTQVEWTPATERFHEAGPRPEPAFLRQRKPAQ